MSLHFAGIYQLKGTSHLVERRIAQLKKEAQEKFEVPPAAFLRLYTDDIHSSKAYEAHCTAVVLTGQDSRDFYSPLGINFPQFSDVDRQHLKKTFSEKFLTSLNDSEDLSGFRTITRAHPLLDKQTQASLKKVEQFTEAKIRLSQLLQSQDCLNRYLAPSGGVFSRICSIFQSFGKSPKATFSSLVEDDEQQFTELYEKLCNSDTSKKIQHEEYDSGLETVMTTPKKVDNQDRAMYFYDGRSHFLIDPDAKEIEVPDSAP